MTDVQDAADTLAEVNKAFSNDTTRPEIEPPADGSVELTRGLQHDGEWFTDALVRELRGVDEEVITKFDMAKHTLPELTNLILQRGVERIGTVDITKTPAALDALSVGDREHLLLAIATTTYGDEREYPGVLCPGCGEKNDVTVSIEEDIPIRRIENPQETEYPFTLRNGSVATFRPVNGSDQLVTAKVKSTIAEVNTVLIGRCLLAVDGEPVKNGQKWARDLGLADRRKLVSWMAELQPGPQLGEINITCDECGKEAPLVLSWTELLPFQ